MPESAEIETSPAYISFVLAQERIADLMIGLKNTAWVKYARYCGLKAPWLLYSGSYNYLALLNTHTEILALMTIKRLPKTAIEKLAATLMSFIK